MCANVRRAQELVDSHSHDVYKEPPTDYENYETSKIMYNKIYILDIPNNREIFGGP